MTMIRFADEDVYIKQCTIGSVVGLDITSWHIRYGHITGFSEDSFGEILLIVKDSRENELPWSPSTLLWNI